MDEQGLLLLFSSFPFALLLIMLTDLAEQQTQAAAERERLARLAAAPAAFAEPGRTSRPSVPDPRAWDVRRFFYA